MEGTANTLRRPDIDPGTEPERFYDQSYFAWQQQSGRIAPIVRGFLFKDFIAATDQVIDFGCGGGYMLAALHAKKKIGVEINAAARKAACMMGIEVCAQVEELPDEFADVVISSHALEHVTCPYDTLTELYPKIKPGGTLVFVVPHNGLHQKFVEDDPNMHLYTWNALTLGNLFTAAGYQVMAVDVFRHVYPPDYLRVRSLLAFGVVGRKLFDLVCFVYALVKRRCQIRVVAQKDSEQ